MLREWHGICFVTPLRCPVTSSLAAPSVQPPSLSSGSWALGLGLCGARGWNWTSSWGLLPQPVYFCSLQHVTKFTMCSWFKLQVPFCTVGRLNSFSVGSFFTNVLACWSPHQASVCQGSGFLLRSHFLPCPWFPSTLSSMFSAHQPAGPSAPVLPAEPQPSLLPPTSSLITVPASSFFPLTLLPRHQECNFC